MIWIRELSRDEAAYASLLVQELYLNTNRPILSDRQQASLRRAAEIECDPEEMQREAASREAILLGVFVDGRFDGAAAARIDEQEVVEIKRIYLQSVRRGAGRQMMEQLLQWAKMQSARSVEAEIYKPNRAARKYIEKQGFQKSGSRPSPLIKGVTIVRYRHVG